MTEWGFGRIGTRRFSRRLHFFWRSSATNGRPAKTHFESARACAVNARIFPVRSGHFDATRNAQIVRAGAHSRTRGSCRLALAISGKTAEIGPKPRIGRPAEIGRAKPAKIAPVATRPVFWPPQVGHAKLRKKRDARGVKIEIAPVYVDIRTSAQRYTLGSEIAFRNAGMERLKSTNVRCDFSPVYVVWPLCSGLLCCPCSRFGNARKGMIALRSQTAPGAPPYLLADRPCIASPEFFQFWDVVRVTAATTCNGTWAGVTPLVPF